MAKITKIETQKRKGRINVFVENKFSFGISEMLVIDYDLFVGKEITKKEILKYKEGDNKRKCMEKAYSLLSVRPRSEKELKDKLQEKFSTKDIEVCFVKLKDYGYINDSEFAEKWTGERESHKGKRALIYELKKKGISDEIIERSLSNIDEDSEYKSALNLVQSKRKYQNLSKDEAYKKIGSFLSRRGYSYGVVKKVIEEIHTK